jgi:hypothetical protein
MTLIILMTIPSLLSLAEEAGVDESADAGAGAADSKNISAFNTIYISNISKPLKH